MKVVLAEKPSVARDIASALGASTKKEGYFEGNGWIVTYAFGHLVQIAEPEEMNPRWGKPWRLEQLPMLPGENGQWKYRLADKAAPQFKIIKKLFNDPGTSIVCATDAGREGEHIFRLIYQLTGCKKPVERLWISSLTQDAIKEGFKNLKPAREFDNLAAAASGRARADWIVGLNFTRAYTSLNQQLLTVGRVQTPTLAMIVTRQEEIDRFQPEPFYEILATFEPGFIARYITPGASPQTRLKDKVKAQKILSDITPITKGLVESIKTREKRSAAPALYDLLTLQKDANKHHGYTAQETLDLAQSLYEQYKLISYPRTESRHLSTDIVGELPRILSAVLKSPTTLQVVRDAFFQEGITPGGITASFLKQRLSKRYVDDTKLTDHHAIIPTHNSSPGELPQKERHIYELVAMRFMAIFLPPEIRDETEAVLKLDTHAFLARGVVVKDRGWTVLEPSDGGKIKEKEDNEKTQRLPPLAKSQLVPKKKQELKESKTSPPRPFDDASLLTAMKTAGKAMDDEDLPAHMKESGLGTPATRAAIIERLLQSGYVERRKKELLPTEKGKAFIQSIHPELKDVTLTARWEQKLADMLDGKVSLSTFETEIAGFLRQLLPQVIKHGGSLSKQLSQPLTGKAQSESDADALGPCPICKQGAMRLSPKAVGCSRWREGCKFTV